MIRLNRHRCLRVRFSRDPEVFNTVDMNVSFDVFLSMVYDVVNIFIRRLP